MPLDTPSGAPDPEHIQTSNSWVLVHFSLIAGARFRKVYFYQSTRNVYCDSSISHFQVVYYLRDWQHRHAPIRQRDI